MKKYTLPIRFDLKKPSGDQISERVNLILDDVRSKRGAKVDFLEKYPEYDNRHGINLLRVAFAKCHKMTCPILWLHLEQWVEDVKKRQPDWFITKG